MQLSKINLLLNAKDYQFHSAAQALGGARGAMPWGPSSFLSLAKENKTTQIEPKNL